MEFVNKLPEFITLSIRPIIHTSCIVNIRHCTTWC